MENNSCLLHSIVPSCNWYLPLISCVSIDNKYYIYGANYSIILFIFNNKQQITKPHIKSLVGHSLRINSVIFIPDLLHSDWFISASQDKSIRLWSCKENKTLTIHKKHNNPIICLSISPIDPYTIYSAEEEGNIIIWKISNDRNIYNDNKLDLGYFHSLNTSDYNIKSKISVIGAPYILKDHIIIGYQIGLLILVNWKTNEIIQRFIGHTDQICTISFSPLYNNIENIMNIDNNIKNLMVTGSKDKTIKIWNIETGKLLNSIDLPKNTSSGKGRNQKDSRQRFWSSVCWNRFNPLQIICSSHSGDMLLFSLSINKKSSNSNQLQIELNDNTFYSLTEDDFENKRIIWKQNKFGSKNGYQHVRSVFNICNINKNTIISISMDRQIGYWNIETKKPFFMIQCTGGHIYDIQSSPLQPSCIALGIGDQRIFLWNPPKFKETLKGNYFDINVIWKGLQSKVTSLKWHPIQENTLAFGTDDGRIGLYDTLSGKYKLYSSKHKGIVYELHYRIVNNSNDSKLCYLYSCGSDNIILVSNNNTSTSSLNLCKYLNIESNITSISLNNDSTILAIALNNGYIIFYSISNNNITNNNWKTEEYSLLLKQQIHSIEIRTISFHPGSLIPNETLKYHNWLACGTKSGKISIIDCVKVDNNELFKTWLLPGHLQCITNLQWSPHDPNLLLSSSYDGTIQLWDARENIIKPLVNCRGHTGRVFSCNFSLLYPEIIYSSSDDHTCKMWNINIKEHISPPKDEGNIIKKIKTKKRKRKKRKTSKSSQIHSNIDINSEILSNNNENIDKVSQQSSSSSSLLNKTLFPLIDNVNKSKDMINKESIQLVNQLYNSNTPNILENNLDIISQQVINSTKQNQLMNSATLQIWSGNINNAFQQIFENNSNISSNIFQQQLLLPLVPICGYNIWQEFLKQQAKFFEDNNNYHLSALYYLVSNEIEKAIDVYKNAGLINDAIILGKLRLGNNHPKINELYQILIEQYKKQMKWEQVALCYLHINSPKDAIFALKQKPDKDNLETARYISSLCSFNNEYNEISEELGFLLLKQNNIFEAKKVLKYNKDFNIFIFILGIEYTLSTLSNKTIIASSRIQYDKQQNEKEDINISKIFTNILTLFNNNTQISKFLLVLWSFISDILPNNYNLEKELIIYEDIVKEYINNRIQYKQYLLYHKTLFLYSLAIIEFLKLEFITNDNTNTIINNFSILYLNSIYSAYKNDNIEKLQYMITKFISIEYLKELNIKDNIILHINSFYLYSILYLWINNDNNDNNNNNITESQLLNIENILLSSSFIKLDKLINSIEIKKKQLHKLIQQEQILNINNIKTGKKRKKNYLSDISLSNKSIDILQNNINKIKEELKELEEEYNKINNKLPYPNTNQSKELLKIAYYKIQQ